MKLTMLCKDEASGFKGCPSVCLDEDNGELVVVGRQADSETFEGLENVLSGENAVRIRPEVVLRAAEIYSARQV